MADNNQSDAARFSLAEELVDSWSDHGSYLESGPIAKPSRILTYWNWLYEVLSGISGRVPEVYLKPPTTVKFLATQLQVVPLLLFLSFCIASFVITIPGFIHGDPQRLLELTDMFGLTCGQKSTWNRTRLDLRKNKFLYTLNPFDTTNGDNGPYAKTICVPSCPTNADVCDVQTLPRGVCTDRNKYRCLPSFPFSEPTATLQLPFLPNALYNQSYFRGLLRSTQNSCLATGEGIPEYYRQFESAFMYNNNTSTSLPCGRFFQLTSQYPGMGPCYPVWAQTTPYNGRCQPRFSQDNLGAMSAYAKKAGIVTSFGVYSVYGDGEIMRRDLYAINTAWMLLLVMALGLPVLLSAIWMQLLNWQPGSTIWLGCWLCSASFFTVSILCFQRAGTFGKSSIVGQGIKDLFPNSVDPTSSDRTLWLIVASVLVIVSVFLVLFTLAAHKHIRLVVDTLQASKKAIATRRVVYLFAWPVIIVYVGCSLYFLYGTIFVLSQADLKPVYRTDQQASASLPIDATKAFSNIFNTTGSPNAPQYTFTDERLKCAFDPNCRFSLSFSSSITNNLSFLLFGWWLGNEFLLEIVTLSVAFAMSHFYFLNEDGTASKPLTMIQSFTRTALALPTICVGSFMNAAVDWVVFIRPTLEVVDQFIGRALKRHAKKGSKRFQWLFTFLGIGADCVQLSLEYIERDGYVMAALNNVGYREGCRKVAQLQAANEEGLHDVTAWMDLLMTLQKACIAAICSMGALAWTISPFYNNIRKHPDTFLPNPWVVILYTALSAFNIAEYFFQVTEITSGLLVLQFCNDSVLNGGVPKHCNPTLVRAFKRAEERKRSPTVPATFFSHWASGVNDSGRSPSPSPRLGDSSEGQEQRLEGGLEQVRGISDGDGKSGVSKQGGVELLVVQPKEVVM